ncbi:MAG: DUF5677 domain-containing protein [Gallionellaceae bacterium]
MAKISDLVAFAENEYLLDFINKELLPAIANASSPSVRDRLGFIFLERTTTTLRAICALNELNFGEEAIVLARTIFEFSIRLAYIYLATTDSEKDARAKAFIARGYEDRQQRQKQIIALKAEGKCLDLIKDLEAAAPVNFQVPTEEISEAFPNEQRMAKELKEPYECDWHFLYWSVSKMAHPTAINLLGSSEIDGDPWGDGGRALLTAFNYHYRLATIVCSRLSTPGNALNHHLELKARDSLALVKSITTADPSKPQE